MQTSLSAPASDLAGMIATLCSYESWFGPYHSQTLQLTTTVAIAYGEQGRFAEACRLLERVLRDTRRLAGPSHDLRLRALTALRDLWVQQRDLEKVTAVQREVVACNAAAHGADHAETLAARRYLATLLLLDAVA
jgi:hypothetical protein